MPKVSVIIPVHNTERYLPTCLNSVLNQTEEDIEVLCVDDHSTDCSLEILKFYEKLYPYKMKVFRLIDKKGVSCARNLGLSYAQGEYIGFVDSDDLVSLTMFQDFYRYAKEYGTSIVVGNNFRISSDAYLNQELFVSETFEKPRVVNYLDRNPLFFLETPAVWDKLFSHDFLEGFSFLENRIYEDISFTYPLLLKAKETLQVLRDDYAYRRTPGSIMSKETLVQKSVADILDVCSYSLHQARLWNFSLEQMSLLEDLLKASLQDKILMIQRNWNLKENEKKIIVQTMLALGEYLIPDFFSFSTTYASTYFSKKIELLKRMSFPKILNENQYQFQKLSFERKLSRFEKHRN